MVRTRRIYVTSNGKAPYEKWLEGLRDIVGRSRIRARINRAALGNLGDHRAVGRGVIELRVDHGPGYRVYVGLQGHEFIILLHGGDKSTQERDIQKAQDYWNDYLRRL